MASLFFVPVFSHFWCFIPLMQIRVLYTAALLLGTVTAGRAQFATDPRSDSLDIIRQHIHIAVTDFTNHTITASSTLELKALADNVNGIRLDLYEFTVDSVKIGNTPAAFSHNDSLLHIPFTGTLNTGDSTALTVWYRGAAQQGSGGWGGFYWSQNIAFNMGVTLYDVPHNAGRFWFPCFDNFTEKAYYDVRVTTQGGHSGICGGTLINQQTNPDLTKTFHWQLNRPVPSYLVSVAVGPFAFVHKTFTGSNGPIPVILAALPGDTTGMKNSFANLEAAFHIYEQHYGPYLWERVGYVLVPFEGGAMEHATNIAYQKTLVNGALTYETVMAHELSHHWWGDLVTCETAEDMWINEGMAVYSEYVFLENRYDRATALASVRPNHTSVLKTAHVADAGYHPLSGVPQANTYGKHSYEKGANVAWSLRGYMGDSLFYKGLRAVLNSHRFANINAPQFRDVLLDSTGFDAGPFFADWITQPGFAEFLLDSFTVTPAGGQYSVNVYTSQRLRHANHLYTQVPLEVTFVGANRQQWSQTLVHGGATSQDLFLVPFEPAAVFINRSQKLLYAVTADEREIKTTGNTLLSYSNIKYNTTAVADSALVRTEYHWAQPDGPVHEPWKYELTPDRFWKVDGIFPTGFAATATFAFDGSANGPDSPIIYSEDSVVLFYRANSGHPWRPAPGYAVNPLAQGDKKGNLTAPLLKGEYCIGTKREEMSINEPIGGGFGFLAYPNPSADGEFRLQAQKGALPANARVLVTDASGRQVFSGKITATGNLSLKNAAPGTYAIHVFDGTKKIGQTTVVIARK